jgi:hypothetical protein
MEISRADRQSQILQGPHIHHCIVDKHHIEPAVQPDGAHISLDMFQPRPRINCGLIYKTCQGMLKTLVQHDYENRIINPSTGRKGRVFALVVNGSKPGLVAVFEGAMPAQTRPYGYGTNYLRTIIRRALV